jgi:DNA-binding NarL/FixJ family response regulator
MTVPENDDGKCSTAEQRSSTEAISIFLCDDHAVFRDAMKFVIEIQADLRVVGDAGNGEEAVARVRQVSPDMVVMDLMMPKMDGIEATREILRVRPFTKIVILSMYSTPDYVSRSLGAGAQGYLLKEAPVDEIITAIRSVHQGKRYLSKSINEMIIDGYIGIQKEKIDLVALDALGGHENEILRFFIQGRSDRRIAEMVGLPADTVSLYRSLLLKNWDTWKLRICRSAKYKT